MEFTVTCGEKLTELELLMLKSAIEKGFKIVLYFDQSRTDMAVSVVIDDKGKKDGKN